MNQPDVKYVSSLYGGFWNFEIKDFCYMTNPYFPPEGFVNALGERLRQMIKAYPSTNWYISSLAAEPLGLTHEEVVVANGASELINAITDSFVDRLVVPVPTFDEFINRAHILGKQVSLFRLLPSEDFEVEPERLIRSVQDSGANSVLIINPNNPTGKLLSIEKMRLLLESLASLELIVVDESFNDFVSNPPSPSVMKWLSDFPNVIVLKSLSKSYGIPGLRLGYAASSNKKRISELRSKLPIWNINSFAQYFLETMREYSEDFLVSCTSVRAATNKLYEGLRSVSYLHPYPSEGNYVLSRVLHSFTGESLTANLFNEFGMLINNMSTKRGLESEEDNFVRMASKTAEENAELIRAVQELEATMAK